MRTNYEYYKAIRRIYGMTASQAFNHMRKMYDYRNVRHYINVHFASAPMLP